MLQHFYLHLQDVGNRVTLMTNLLLLRPPFLCSSFLCSIGNALNDLGMTWGPPFWTINMDPQFGTPIWDPDLGPPSWTPVLDPQYGPPIWTPNLDPQYLGGDFRGDYLGGDLGGD
jgi:hypothetical protein